MDGQKRRRAQGPQQAMLREEQAAKRTAEPPEEAPAAQPDIKRRRRAQPAQSSTEQIPAPRRPKERTQHVRQEKPRAKRRTSLSARIRMRCRKAIKTLKRKGRFARRAAKGALYTLRDGFLILIMMLAVMAAAAWRLAKDAACSVWRLLRRMCRKIYRAAGRTPQERLRSAVSLGLAATAVFSACMVGSIVIRTIRTKRLNQALSAQFSAYQGDMWQEETETETAAQETMLMQEMPLVPEQEDTPAPQDISGQKEEQAAQEEIEAEATKAPPIVKSTVFHQVGGDALANMEALYDQNRDLIAWLNIPDVIDLPVVYRDNDYYLKHDFYKQRNDAGTIFLDEHHPFKEKTQNLLLHGHNMKDGTMFGRLTQYLTDSTYIKNHPFINFSTLWRQEQYVIFAVLDVSLNPASEDFFNYFSYSTFSSDEEFSFFARELQLRSEYAIPIDVKPSDALLMLSTCLEDDRLVIAARRVREGETRSELRQMIHMAMRQ